MNVRFTKSILHSFSVKNIFNDKMDLNKAFLFSCGDLAREKGKN